MSAPIPTQLETTRVAAGFSSNSATRAEPKPALGAAKLYFGDNGRVHCGALRCAGNSAHFTGRTIAGQRVKAAKPADAEAFAAAGITLKCETCGLEHSS